MAKTINTKAATKMVIGLVKNIDPKVVREAMGFGLEAFNTYTASKQTVQEKGMDKQTELNNSIAETAKANHIRTYHYFEHLLTEIPKQMDDTDLDFIEDLLPWSPNLLDSYRFIK